MIRIKLLIINLFKALNLLILLNKLNKIIRIGLKANNRFPKPPNLLCFDLLLVLYQQLQKIIVAQQLARIIQHKLMQNLQIDILQ